MSRRLDHKWCSSSLRYLTLERVVQLARVSAGIIGALYRQRLLSGCCTDPKSLVIDTCEPMTHSHPFSFSAFNNEASFETGVGGVMQPGNRSGSDRVVDACAVSA